MSISKISDFAAPGAAEIQREVWLLGQPRLGRYLDFVREKAVGGASERQSALVDEWRAANDHFCGLEEAEAGIADRVEIRDLDPAMLPLAAQVEADSRYRQIVEAIPARFAMVELDKLVTPQQHVNLDHIERLKARISPNLPPAELFKFCMPLDRAETPVNVRQTGSKSYTFWSDSSDFRFHGGSLLGAGNIIDHDPIGPIAAAVGLMVGFSSNFLMAIQSDSRLLLHNGNHRVYALRDAGFTHAPCLIQEVTRREELELIASRRVIESAAFYFKGDRPPMIKDYFDPKLRKTHRVHKIQRMVEVSFEVREFEVKDLAAAR